MCGCRRPTTVENPEGLATVKLTIECNKASSRSGVESNISDLNFYLFGDSNFHFFTGSGGLAEDIPYGEYTVMVIANAGKNLGKLTEEQVKGLAIDYSPDGRIPMSGTAVIQVAKENGPVQQFPPISITRNVAKLVYNIKISEKAGELSLYSVQFFNLPARTRPFRYDKISQTGSDYYNTPVILLEGAGKYHSGEIFIGENLQGVNPDIKTGSEKTFENAPPYATFMVVRVHSPSGFYDYVIYPGENTTDSFNIPRNTFTTLNITIEGTNRFDARIHSFQIGIEDAWIDSASYAAVEKEVYAITDSPLYSFNVNVKAEWPGKSTVVINGVETPETNFTLKANEILNIRIDAGDELVTAGNENLHYIITVSDNLGYELQEEGAVRLMNYVSVEHYSYYLGGHASLRILGGNLLGSYTTENGTYLWECGTYAGESAYFRASASGLYSFEGWYDENRQFISDNPDLRHFPSKRRSHFYFNAYRN